MFDKFVLLSYQRPLTKHSHYTFNDLMYLTNNGTTMNQALKEGVAPNQNVTWETATQKNI